MQSFVGAFLLTFFLSVMYAQFKQLRCITDIKNLLDIYTGINTDIDIEKDIEMGKKDEFLEKFKQGLLNNISEIEAMQAKGDKVSQADIDNLMNKVFFESEIQEKGEI